MNNIVIETIALTKSYKENVVLNNLSLTVNKGEIFGFLGHNGAGKTTTVSILTTLLTQTSGDAYICGFNVLSEKIEVQKRIGYLPENVKFYDNLSAYENLEYLANISKVKNLRDKIEEVLVFLDFTDFKNKKLGEFSKGMRQRIGIAQAILHEPEVLFLDEPTSGLDPMGIKTLRDIIIKLNKEKGITIFMNTHLLSEVSKTCTQIAVLNHGRLIYTDSLTNTLNKFKDEASLEEIYFTVDAKN